MVAIAQPQHLELILHREERLQLPRLRHGLTIECTQGVLWVTRAGDIEDYVLYPGERYAPRHHGKIVVEAMREARVRLTES
jgi:hypothetical protein